MLFSFNITLVFWVAHNSRMGSADGILCVYDVEIGCFCLKEHDLRFRFNCLISLNDFESTLIICHRGSMIWKEEGRRKWSSNEAHTHTHTTPSSSARGGSACWAGWDASAQKRHQRALKTKFDYTGWKCVDSIQGAGVTIFERELGKVLGNGMWCAVDGKAGWRWCGGWGVWLKTINLS